MYKLQRQVANLPIAIPVVISIVHQSSSIIFLSFGLN